MASASPLLSDLRQKLLTRCQTGKCDTETYELAKQIITREILEEGLDSQFRYFILTVKRYIRLNQVCLGLVSYSFITLQYTRRTMLP